MLAQKYIQYIIACVYANKSLHGQICGTNFLCLGKAIMLKYYLLPLSWENQNLPCLWRCRQGLFCGRIFRQKETTRLLLRSTVNPCVNLFSTATIPVLQSRSRTEPCYLTEAGYASEPRFFSEAGAILEPSFLSELEPYWNPAFCLELEPYGTSFLSGAGAILEPGFLSGAGAILEPAFWLVPKPHRNQGFWLEQFPTFG